MKQLVISGNRILAHGEDCFLSMGGTVICPDTGKVYQSATVVNCEGEIPADIDSVGYEYHAGEFVPCAPFGKGGGNVAVLCPNDCKSIKDSGKSAEHLANVAVVEYIGTGTTSVSVTVDFEPLFAVVYDTDTTVYSTGNFRYVGIITPNGGFMFQMKHPKNTTTEGETTPHYLFSSVADNTLSWNCPFTDTNKATYALNTKNHSYKAFVVGRA